MIDERRPSAAPDTSAPVQVSVNNSRIQSSLPRWVEVASMYVFTLSLRCRSVSEPVVFRYHVVRSDSGAQSTISRG